jgi:UDP-2,3-diacylglucosamine pyrophosphatase LpxH
MIKKVSDSPSEEKPIYKKTAAMILERGYDVVIFGHTHRTGEYEISPGKYYYNTGSWFDYPHYIEINNGKIDLKRLEH